MSRLRVLVLAAALASASCRIERTPEEYVDHRDPTAGEIEAAEDQIHDRVVALGQAVSRGDAASALEAFSPAPDVRAIGPVEGLTLRGAEQIDSALRQLAGGRTRVEMRDVEVEVGPRANVAWFRALVAVGEDGPVAGRTLRATGVYLLDEGTWQLVQAHLSLPTALSDLQPSPDAAGDSLAAGSPPAGSPSPAGGSWAARPDRAGTPAARRSPSGTGPR